MRATPLSRFISRSTKATLVTILIMVNVLAAIATIISAYGGIIDPNLSILPALMSMMLPGILIGDLLLTTFDLLMRKWRIALIIAASWLVSLPPLLTYSPLHIGQHKLTQAEKKRSFTLLTYNALHFWDFRGNIPGIESNSTIDYILKTDADIVNLQEVEFIKTWPLWHITPEQISRLKEKYPYRMVDINNQLTILSKYPLQYDDIPLPSPMDVRMALFRLDIQGHRVNLFDVHLESIGLNMDDKALYQNLFDKAPGNEHAIRKEISDVKRRLISKLAVAFRKRTEQARFIRHTIDSIGGNFIVAGDFNDIQGCYALRTIMDGDMKDAYAENAFGPTITYHGNRFYFRIDHVLYKGDMKAVDIERGDIESSDHYPLLTTFVFDRASP